MCVYMHGADLLEERGTKFQWRSDSFMHYIIACLHRYAYPSLKSNAIKLWLSLSVIVYF